MSKPKRIQRKRTKGWKMPPNTIYVGRPTKWGNIFKVGKDGNAEECVVLYMERMIGNIWNEPNKFSIKRELKGKDLTCWCKEGEPCHADVLLEVANK